MNIQQPYNEAAMKAAEAAALNSLKKAVVAINKVKDLVEGAPLKDVYAKAANLVDGLQSVLDTAAAVKLQDRVQEFENAFAVIVDRFS